MVGENGQSQQALKGAGTLTSMTICVGLFASFIDSSKVKIAMMLMGLDKAFSLGTVRIILVCLKKLRLLID